jgi:hypothetical protein
MDGGDVAGVGFVVPGGNSPELLQLGEGVLDQVAPAVRVAVEADGGLAVGLDLSGLAPGDPFGRPAQHW